MRRTWLKAAVMLAALAALAMSLGLTPVNALDFGSQQERRLHLLAQLLFGFGKPLDAPADAGDVVPRETATAEQRVLLARGLRVSFVARNVATLGDMMSFWPNDTQYTHLIVCIEQGRATGGLNPGVQRVHVSSGRVETILYGMSRCDGIRTTPWGTVLATEETGDGRSYEILDPIGTTGHWVANRATGDIRDGINSPTQSTTVVQRQSLPTMAWEGLAVLPNGVIIAGDELRPGSGGVANSDGGAIFRFVPDVPFQCEGPLNSPGAVCQNPITNLAQSPLVAGRTYALQIQCTSGVQFGQGCEIGQGSWLRVDPLTARSDANTRGATGYYRPEDLERDPTFGAADLADLSQGIRFCWTNTGDDEAANYAETLCAVDQHPTAAQEITVTASGLTNTYLSPDGTNRAVTTANRFIEGDTRFNSHDNLAFQPISGITYIIEDNTFGEIYACLPDGADRDLKSDGCVAMLSVRDPQAEPTGFIFDATGKVAFLIIQHGQQPAQLFDFNTNPIDGRTDDLIKIEGFRLP